MLDGDVSEPRGTMSGGTAPSGSGMLVRAQELRAVEERVEDARRTLEALGWVRCCLIFMLCATFSAT